MLTVDYIVIVMRLFRATFEASGPIPNLNSILVDGVGTSLRLLGEEAQEQIDAFRLQARSTPERDMVTLTVDVEPTSPYPMSKVHAMASQIHYCLAALISQSNRRFRVTTAVYDPQLQDFMRAIPQDESFYEPTNIWAIATNRRIILDIADWLRTIGPVYNDCFVDLERYADENELFNPLTLESESIKTALSRANINLVILSPSEKGVVKKDELEFVGSDYGDGGRIPCKTQGSLARDNLVMFRFVDIQKAGVSLNHFVIQTDYLDAVAASDRVFAIIPSFWKYPGLVSESVLRGENQVGAMHCTVDVTKTYRMSFMFPCGLSKGLKMPAGKTCVSDETMYKTKMFQGQQCKFPTEVGVDLDTGCCVSNPSWRILREAMIMYARKTRADNKKYNYLKDIHDWYVQAVGPIRAHDTSISLVYPPEEDSISEYNAFMYMQPVVKDLHVIKSDPGTNFSTFVDWFGDVGSVFRMRERYDVRITYPMTEDARNIDNEYISWVIHSIRPKHSLTLDLRGALFVDNDVGPILNAMYDTENFHLKLVIHNLLDERMSDPTDGIVQAGFVEKESAQELIRDLEDPDEFQDFRHFIKGHATVDMSYTYSHFQLNVATSHAFV